MAEVIRTKAIILRRTNYGEADRILQVLTPQNGKLSIMAKGVRREKSRLAGGIELFAICDVVLHFGRGEIATLTGARLNKFFDQILLDYDRMQFAYETLKQISAASQSIDEPEFYSLTEDCLAALNDLKIGLKIIKSWFYLSLAKLLGNQLNTATDDSGMKLVEDARYDFDPSDQVFRFNETGHYDARTLKLLRVMTSNHPSVIAKIADIDDLLDDCVRLAQIVAKV
jgi:DNA repair protein RecO (recombination protein O)